MKKVMLTSLLVGTLLITGCGNKEEKKDNKENNNVNTPVVEEQETYEGLEFVNAGVKNGIVKTVVINNTGKLYEGSKFTMKIMDSNGNILLDMTDEVKNPMENGTTQTIETKTDIDLSSAASIEYSIVK